MLDNQKEALCIVHTISGQTLFIHGSDDITTMDIMAYCCAGVHRTCIDRFIDQTRVCPIAHPALKRAYVDIEFKKKNPWDASFLLPDDTCTRYQTRYYQVHPQFKMYKQLFKKNTYK